MEELKKMLSLGGNVVFFNGVKEAILDVLDVVPYYYSIDIYVAEDEVETIYFDQLREIHDNKFIFEGNKYIIVA